MDVRFSCHKCGQHIDAPEEMVGQRVNCPGCQQPLTVPDNSTIPTESKPEAKDISFDCCKCGQNIVIDEAGAGQLVDCPKCGTKLAVPNKSEPSQIAMTCKWCHKDITVDASLAGHLTHCPLCDDFIMPPGPTTSAPSKQSAVPTTTPATATKPTTGVLGDNTSPSPSPADTVTIYVDSSPQKPDCIVTGYARLAWGKSTQWCIDNRGHLEISRHLVEGVGQWGT